MESPEIEEIAVLKQQLETYLPPIKAAGGCYEYYELCGFLVAVCSSPELIRPAEWLPIVLGEELQVPESLGEPAMVLEAIMGLYNWVNNRILCGETPLPDDLKIQEDVFANFGEQAPVAQWSRGFYEGHDWLADVWDGVVSGKEEWEEELSSYLLPLSFFQDENFARAIYEDFARQDKTFTEVAEYMAMLFNHAANDYAHLGRAIYEAMEELEAPDEIKVQHDEPSVGRDDPCPCGSGKEYKKCCLH